MTGAAPRRGRLTVSILIAVLAAALGACGPGIGEAAKDRGGETPPQQTEDWFYDSFNEEQKMAYDAFRSMAEEPFGEEPVPILDGQGNAASAFRTGMRYVIGIRSGNINVYFGYA